jgi:hypothetical protein
VPSKEYQSPIVELEQTREHGKLGLPSRNHWLGLLDLFLLL